MNTALNKTKSSTPVSDEQAMLEVTFLLDEWEVPQPSPWFDNRMMARFREEQQRSPQRWFARLRDRFELGNSLSYRPMLAGVMVLFLLAGGGSYLEFAHLHRSGSASATLQDLQILDSNDQAIQQMDQLLDGPDDNSSNGSSL